MKFITTCLLLIMIILNLCNNHSSANDSSVHGRNTNHNKDTNDNDNNNSKFIKNNKNDARSKMKKRHEDFLIEIADEMTELALRNDVIDTFFEI